MWAERVAVGADTISNLVTVMNELMNGGYAAMPKLWSGCCAGAAEKQR